MIQRDILVDVNRGCATVTLNRPEKLNALTRETEALLEETLVKLGRDSSIRVILLTGAGRGFCCGRDSATLDKSPMLKDPSVSPPTFIYLRSIPKPVISVINGAVAGSGFILALASDIRFAGENALFTASFSRLGLPSEGGLSWLLPRMVGQGKALEILFSSRRVSAREALEIGLVERLCPQEELMVMARQYAGELAERSASSLAMIKEQGWSAWTQSLDESFYDAAVKLRSALVSSDFKEGVDALRERRSPRFGVLESNNQA